MGRIKWLGQSGFEIISEENTILIDPFLSENPKAPIETGEIEDADLVCVTHDHMDHLGDAIEICKENEATFLSTFELGNYAEEQGVEETIGMNIGGTIEIKNISVTMVQAFHTSERGAPVGYVLNQGEKSIYHAGDTGIFGDMKLIGEIYDPEIACLPIGDYYTMGPKEAAKAVELINPEIVVPMHYMTFPVLEQSADNFLNEVKSQNVEVQTVVLDPGKSFEF